MNFSALPFPSSDVTAPPDALDWLRVQSELRRLSRHLGNGESSAPARAVRSLAYRFGGAPIGLWQARAEPADSGAHTRALARVWAGRRFVGAEPLYAAFAASADAMLAAPPSIATRRVDLHVAADRLPAVGVELRGILADVADDVSVYLHGSRAAGDETPFSDVDDLVVVHASAWQSWTRFRRAMSRLERAARFMQSVDPLQHHGHWLYTDIDLACHDEAEMPLLVLDGAVLVIGRPSFTARVRRDVTAVSAIGQAIAGEIRTGARLSASGSIRLDALKDLVGAVSLIPALVRQASGEAMGKRDAIARAGETFSDEAVTAVRWATAVRANWGTVPGYERVRRLCPLFRRLPWTRPTMEGIARRLAPRVACDRLPRTPRALPRALARLADESAAALAAGRHG